MQPQGNSQDRFAYTNESYVRGSTPVRAVNIFFVNSSRNADLKLKQHYPWPHPPPFDFAQPATPHHDLQPRTVCISDGLSVARYMLLIASAGNFSRGNFYAAWR